MKLRIARKVMKRVQAAISEHLVVHKDGGASIYTPWKLVRKAAGRLSTYYRAERRLRST